jgi:type I restriction enzyme S subunit
MWPRLRLGELLSLLDTSVPVIQLDSVNLAGVYSFGRGLFKRGPMEPGKTTYKKYNRLVVDDFVLSQPKAWEGAIAKVTPEFDGWFLSPVFPTFRVNRQRLDPGFLEWFCKCKTTWGVLQRKSHGIGARRETVSPEQFLSTTIPLPPLTEQQHIVARIDELAAKISETRRIQEEIESKTHRLLMAAYHQIAGNIPCRPFGEVAPLTRRPVIVDSELDYPQVAVRSFGKGTFHKPPLVGRDVTWQKPFLVKRDDILISNIKAWEGAIAVTRPSDDGRLVSHRYLTCVPMAGVATPHFVCFHLLTPDGLRKIGDASPGTADRNRTLNLKSLLEIPTPVPPFEQQRWFDGLCQQIDASRQLRLETAAQLDALLPSILDKAFKGEL